MWSQHASRPASYAVGSLLNNGRYRVQKRLNKGATAVVYAAEDLHTGRSVALKVVQCGSSNKVPLNVVRREVALSSSVAHENMVQLLDVFAEGTELIIVWELIAGGDLLELLNECHGCMTEPAAAFYYSQLLRGVLHMHAMGYCHRDIKPENCMIEAGTQRLKLIDFGLSKHLESVATLGVGTPDYMPPEMVNSQMKQQHMMQQKQQGLPPYDAQAVDAWAMGVLLYLLVTGCYPFEDPLQPNNLAATLLNVQAGRCQPLPDSIGPGCREIIRGLLCPDPPRRTRLRDLAFNPWLRQSAAAHAARLGLTGLQHDLSSPAWLLPSASIPVQAPSTSLAHPSVQSSSMLPTSAPRPVHWQQQQQTHTDLCTQHMQNSQDLGRITMQQQQQQYFWEACHSGGQPHVSHFHQQRVQDTEPCYDAHGSNRCVTSSAGSVGTGFPGRCSRSVGTDLCYQHLLHTPGVPNAARSTPCSRPATIPVEYVSQACESMNGTNTAPAPAGNNMTATSELRSTTAGFTHSNDNTLLPGSNAAAHRGVSSTAAAQHCRLYGSTLGWQQPPPKQEYGNIATDEQQRGIQAGMADASMVGPQNHKKMVEDAAHVYVTKQGDMADDTAEQGLGKERRSGFVWLQSLVKKRA